MDMGSWYDIVLKVALFARAWIEMPVVIFITSFILVALFARAWIEIFCGFGIQLEHRVALFARAWIEIAYLHGGIFNPGCRPLCEGVD